MIVSGRSSSFVYCLGGTSSAISSLSSLLFLIKTEIIGENGLTLRSTCNCAQLQGLISVCSEYDDFIVSLAATVLMIMGLVMLV